jgi:hypothetical protein
MPDLQVRHPPASVAHVQGHEAQTLGFQFTCGARPLICFSVRPRRENQPLPMYVSADTPPSTIG